MMNIKNKKGFTLIEIIVSIAILGIIAVCFLPAFTSGFSWIINAGHRGIAQFDAQGQIEQDLADRNMTVGASLLEIEFEDADDNIEVSGEIKTQTNISRSSEVSITFFAPDR